MYMPFPLYMHCGLWRNRHFHCTCTVVWWCIYLWNLCGWLRHVALTTGVFGEIRLSAVSYRLANSKPLSLSVLVCVDDVRDWTVVARGSTLALGQFVSPPRRLAPLRCSAPRGSLSLCLDNKQLPLPSWPKVQFSPDSSSLVSSPISHSRVVCGYRVVEASATQSVFSGPPHATCAHSTSCTPPSHSSTVRSLLCTRARRATGAYYTGLPT